MTLYGQESGRHPTTPLKARLAGWFHTGDVRPPPPPFEFSPPGPRVGRGGPLEPRQPKGERAGGLSSRAGRSPAHGYAVAPVDVVARFTSGTCHRRWPSQSPGQRASPRGPSFGTELAGGDSRPAQPASCVKRLLSRP